MRSTFPEAQLVPDKPVPASFLLWSPERCSFTSATANLVATSRHGHQLQGPVTWRIGGYEQRLSDALGVQKAPRPTQQNATRQLEEGQSLVHTRLGGWAVLSSWETTPSSASANAPCSSQPTTNGHQITTSQTGRTAPTPATSTADPGTSSRRHRTYRLDTGSPRPPRLPHEVSLRLAPGPDGGSSSSVTLTAPHDTVMALWPRLAAQREAGSESGSPHRRGGVDGRGAGGSWGAMQLEEVWYVVGEGHGGGDVGHGGQEEREGRGVAAAGAAAGVGAGAGPRAAADEGAGARLSRPVVCSTVVFLVEEGQGPADSRGAAAGACRGVQSGGNGGSGAAEEARGSGNGSGTSAPRAVQWQLVVDPTSGLLEALRQHPGGTPVLTRQRAAAHAGRAAGHGEGAEAGPGTAEEERVWACCLPPACAVLPPDKA